MTVDLYTILCCPVTKRPLKKAEPDFVDLVNGLIAKKIVIRDVHGDALIEPVEHILMRDDGNVFYRVCSGIAYLLPEQAIEMSSLPR